MNKIPQYQYNFLKAAAGGDLDMLKKIRAKGAKIDFLPENGETALMQAVKYHQYAVVDYLIEEEVNINQASSNGNTALLIAAARSTQAMMEKLILAGANVNQCNHSLNTALHIVPNGNLQETELLLANGANPNVLNNEGRTPLIEAIEKNRHDIVTTLLKAGANPCQMIRHNHDIYTAVDIVVKRNDFSMMDTLIENGLDIDYQLQGVLTTGTQLMKAVSKKDEAWAEYWVLHGASINARYQGVGRSVKEIANAFKVSGLTYPDFERLEKLAQSYQLKEKIQTELPEKLVKTPRIKI